MGNETGFQLLSCVWLISASLGASFAQKEGFEGSTTMDHLCLHRVHTTVLFSL